VVRAGGLTHGARRDRSGGREYVTGPGPGENAAVPVVKWVRCVRACAVWLRGCVQGDWSGGAERGGVVKTRRCRWLAVA